MSFIFVERYCLERWGGKQLCECAFRRDGESLISMVLMIILHSTFHFYCSFSNDYNIFCIRSFVREGEGVVGCAQCTRESKVRFSLRNFAIMFYQIDFRIILEAVAKS